MNYANLKTGCSSSVKGEVSRGKAKDVRESQVIIGVSILVIKPINTLVLKNIYVTVVTQSSL